MKSGCKLVERFEYGSHPSRGAWIEIRTPRRAGNPPMSHPSRGAWIEIMVYTPSGRGSPGRTPHGVRGLKLHVEAGHVEHDGVAPLTGCVD